MAAVEGDQANVYVEVFDGISRVKRVRCVMCNLNCADKTRFVEHCNTQHSDEHERILRDPRIVQCNGCRQYFNGTTGLHSHHRRNTACKNAQPAAAVNVDAVAVDVQNYTEHELMAPFGDALYHIHRDWEEPFWNISLSLLKGMVPGANCYICTLAFFLLPGVITFIRNQKNQGRVVDFLKRIMALNGSASMGEAIKAEAVRLIRCKERGECPKRPKPRGINGAIRSVSSLVRAGRLSSATRIMDTIPPMIDGSQDEESNGQLVLSLVERRVAVSDLHPRFRSEDLDSLKVSLVGLLSWRRNLSESFLTKK